MELLVVIALIMLLLGVIITVGGYLRTSAQVIGCLSNQHQISVGLSGYSRDHNSRFVSPRTSPVGLLRNDKLWVRSFDEAGHDRVDPEGFERLDALEDGALWPYVGSSGVYRSPLDPTPRLRSYSLSGFISDLPDVPSNPEYGWAPVADRVSEVQNPGNTLYSIVEHDPNENINGHGWVINTNAGIWMDYPAFWKPRGTATSSFVDGSTKAIKFFNPDLEDILVQHGIPAGPETQVDFDRFVEWVRIDR